MGKISYYKKDGTFQYQKELNNENIGETIGMMIRCTMKNGGFCEGFADPFRTHGKAEFNGAVHDFIYLWTWDHLDEETHRLVGDFNTKFDQTFVLVEIQEIESIDAILYSNPRWGGKLINRFSLNV